MLYRRHWFCLWTVFHWTHYSGIVQQKSGKQETTIKQPMTIWTYWVHFTILYFGLIIWSVRPWHSRHRQFFSDSTTRVCKHIRNMLHLYRSDMNMQWAFKFFHFCCHIWKSERKRMLNPFETERFWKQEKSVYRLHCLISMSFMAGYVNYIPIANSHRISENRELRQFNWFNENIKCSKVAWMNC